MIGFFKNMRTKTYSIDDNSIFSKDINKDITPSYLIGFSKRGFDCSIEHIIKRLKANKNIMNVVLQEEELVVTTNFNKMVERVSLKCLTMNKQVIDFLITSMNLPGCNLGVTNANLSNVKHNSTYVLSTMNLSGDRPYESYKAQAYVLGLALDLEFLFDKSSRKVFPPQYIPFILEKDLKLFSKNLFSIIALEDSMYSIGLARFHLKDLEIHNTMQDVDKFHQFLESEVLNTIQNGIIKEKNIISYDDKYYIVHYYIEDALNIFPNNYLGNIYTREKDFLINRSILVIYDENNIDFKDPLNYASSSKFLETEGLVFPSNVTTLLYNMVQSSKAIFLAIIKNYTIIKKLLVLKFCLRNGENTEYIFARVHKIDDDIIQVKLLNDSWYNNELEVGSHVNILFEDIVDWYVDKLPFPINPTNTFIFTNETFRKYLEMRSAQE